MLERERVNLQFLVVFDGGVEGTYAAVVATHLETRLQRDQLLVSTGMVPGI